MADVNITVFRWAGDWGPFKIKIPCGECSLTKDVIADTVENELNGIDVEVEIRDWLSEWWKPLLKGGWHAPIVLVDGKLISQGAALNRGVLTQAVIDAHANKSNIQGNHLFGKLGCPHCLRAKEYLSDANIEYRYHDVVKEPRGLYEMLARVKPIVDPKTPITVPQIWIDSEYVGGADQLSELIHRDVEPNPDRGQCSLSPAGR
ncbi:MAG: glutaredoxin [Gammaproteobacteria bacterium]|nr:MAG: glutaredoxin [Gammaproteobacteria bacterium]